MIEEKLLNKDMCTGCHACLNICPKDCINMEYDAEGFLYPKVDIDNCIKCEKCVDVCPTLKMTHDDLKNNMEKGYACQAKDENMRLISSSGGIFSLLAREVIKSGGVVFGAKFNSDFKLLHSYAETMDEVLDKFTGSKYLQSEIGKVYNKVKEFLKDGRLVLFTGTPCQVGGLKTFLGKDYENLLCVDLVCHGVPSPKMWDTYKNYREREAKSTTQRISFRHKKYGWKRFSVLFKFTNNTEYLNTLDKDLYMRAFLKDIALRPSCYDCKFKGYQRFSDITIADFWGIERVSELFNDDLGTSLVILNSSKGQRIFESLYDSLKYEEVDVKKALEYNKAALVSAKKHPLRDEFMSKLGEVEFDELVNSYCKDSLSYRMKMALINILVKTNTFDFAKKLLNRK